jgi:MoaA/NifB/PqqE/SkfB family radical SAM enzyme
LIGDGQMISQALSTARKALDALAWRDSSLIPLFQRAVIELQSHCNRDCFFCSRESDRSGKRKTADGTSIRQALPTEKVFSLLDELEALQFRGHITFHQLSEAFLDKRLMTVAREAKRRGMRPYVHTNGDVLRNDEALCREAAEVFEYIVVGLYDYTSEAEKNAEKELWKRRLDGTEVLFSLVENVYLRTHSPDDAGLSRPARRSYAIAPCAQPRTYLLIHYDGDACCCCEDTYGELLRHNVLEMSIRDIWYSQRHLEVIRALRIGDRGAFDLCSNCTMAPNRYSRDPRRAIRHYDR